MNVDWRRICPRILAGRRVAFWALSLTLCLSSFFWTHRFGFTPDPLRRHRGTQVQKTRNQDRSLNDLFPETKVFSANLHKIAAPTIPTTAAYQKFLQVRVGCRMSQWKINLIYIKRSCNNFSEFVTIRTRSREKLPKPNRTWTKLPVNSQLCIKNMFCGKKTFYSSFPGIIAIFPFEKPTQNNEQKIWNSVKKKEFF